MPNVPPRTMSAMQTKVVINAVLIDGRAMVERGEAEQPQFVVSRWLLRSGLRAELDIREVARFLERQG